MKSLTLRKNLFLLQRSQMQVYSKMWDFMAARPHVFVKTYDEGIRRVREKKGTFATFVQ